MNEEMVNTGGELSAQGAKTATNARSAQIQVSSTTDITTYRWENDYMSTDTYSVVGMRHDGSTAHRMYMTVSMPQLPRNPRVKKAELTVHAQADIVTGSAPKFGVYHVTENITTGSCTPQNSEDLIDYAVMRANTSSYTFDVTKLLDAANKDELSAVNIVLKMLDETVCACSEVNFYGSETVSAPQLSVTYESSYGVNTAYRTYTHELGRFGQGSIDLMCGNLMIESEDFAWAGNRLPVTIKHLYNNALKDYAYTGNADIGLHVADFSAMKLGYGFKLNIMQSMTPLSFMHEGESVSGYVYVGENGEEMYFVQSEQIATSADGTYTYALYESMEDSDSLYDPERCTLNQGEDTYHFDTAGRLTAIVDAYNNRMDITYTDGRITSVTDGADRVFRFHYSDGYLQSIVAPENTQVQYAYADNHLTDVTYPNGKAVNIYYSGNRPFELSLYENGNKVHYVNYAFSGDRVRMLTDLGMEGLNTRIGVTTSFDYSAAANRTVVTESRIMEERPIDTQKEVTVYTFDDDGNVVSEYVYTYETDLANGVLCQNMMYPQGSAGDAGIISMANNLLNDHAFSREFIWMGLPENESTFRYFEELAADEALYGQHVMRMVNSMDNGVANGVHELTKVFPVGDYTFSAYVRLPETLSARPGNGVFLRVTTLDGTVLAESERLTQKDTEYTRLITPFTLTEQQLVRAQIMLCGAGSAFACAPQLESNPYANAYNMLENGNFFGGSGIWCHTAGVTYAPDEHFNMAGALHMDGDIEEHIYAHQSVVVKSAATTRETFALSGWAKGYGIVSHDRDGAELPTFRLRAVVVYADVKQDVPNTETYTADFSPCTEEWQFASVEFAKGQCREVKRVDVYCDYGYNSGEVLFDDIQLVRTGLETNLTLDDFATDVDAEETAVDDTVEELFADFEEAKDAYGNPLTETTFADGEFGTMYRSFFYNVSDPTVVGGNNGNNLVRETDARGNNTYYIANDETSRNDAVIDRCGTQTLYTYDASGRTTKVTSRDTDSIDLAEVSYAYDAFDNMTEIVRGDGMKYVLDYNAFHNLESIGVDGKAEKLIQYEYKESNGRLKQITYANGDTMHATYNGIGQMVAEKWYNASNEQTAHYKYVYDGKGNIARSIDFTAKKVYDYVYENDTLVRSTECTFTHDEGSEILTGKTLVNTVRYRYDTEGKLTKKQIIPAAGDEQVMYYENTENGNAVVKFTVTDADAPNGKRTVVSRSKTDEFGRKEFDELQLGTGFVSRQYAYYAGVATDEHVTHEKLKSTPTTNLVSRIELSNGRVLTYEYDAEERITRVDDFFNDFTDTTKYTYDELGQLTCDNRGGVPICFDYDNYGNIISKYVCDSRGNEIEDLRITYTYGNDVWKDLLTAYDGQPITYDAQGNPLSYLGHTLTWEKGRQLKSFDGNTYTYNANGIRTSKTVNGVRHDYILDGTKILRETWGTNTLIPLYDNEDSVCGIIYNDAPYYFYKNLQGDVIDIADAQANVVVHYGYDAWGVCYIAQDDSGCNISNINPYRYRGYYYDTEIKMYYLQSRYYNPEVGRFINADEAAFLAVRVSSDIDLFAYCINDPIQKCDELGYASYKNTIAKNKMDVITKITGWRTTLTYKYKVDGGVIRFKFADNNYWSVLWRGWAKTLATAMYKAARSISSSYLKGRTITGVHIELFAHWALYKVGIKRSSTKQADMGGCWGAGKDSNAWVFEAANYISKVGKIKIYNVWSYISILRDIARHF